MQIIIILILRVICVRCVGGEEFVIVWQAYVRVVGICYRTFIIFISVIEVTWGGIILFLDISFFYVGCSGNLIVVGVLIGARQVCVCELVGW